MMMKMTMLPYEDEDAALAADIEDNNCHRCQPT